MLKAICKICNNKEKKVIVTEYENNRYFVHCKQCDIIYMSKKKLFTSTLQNEYQMSITVLCEYVNNILDNSFTSVKNILEDKLMFNESMILYLFSEKHLFVNDMGMYNKNGRYTNSLILAHVSKNSLQEMYHNQRVEMLENAKINPTDVSNFDIPWSESF